MPNLNKKGKRAQNQRKVAEMLTRFTKVAKKQVTKAQCRGAKRKKGLAWVPKRSIQAQKNDAQASGAAKAKERRRFKKQLPS